MTATVGRTNFTSAVGVAVAGAPAGVSVVVTPTSLASGTASAALAITVGSSVTPGAYPLAVSVTGSGVATQTATLSLTVVAATPPSVSATVAPTTLSVPQGASATTTLTIVRAGGFAGAVDVTIEGAPSGVTATATPAAIAAGSTTSTITVAAGATAAVGASTLTLRVRGAGVTEQSVALPVAVTAAPGSYTVALDPATVSVAQGGSGGATLNIARTGGFAGAVGIAVSGAPPGLTVTPAATSVTGNAVALTVAATAAVAQGSYPITITTTATGLADRTATLTVTVTPAVVVGSYTLALAPTAVTLAPGGAATSTLNLTRIGGFAGAVGITASGAPPGLTVTPASASVTGSAVAVNVAATAAVNPGTYQITLRGTATGLADQTATLAVTVTPAVTGSFTLALAPTTLTLTQGQTATLTATIARAGGFAGAVDVTVSGLPAGVTATIAPTAAALRAARPSGFARSAALVPIPGSSATIQLAATANAPTGPFTLTVTGTAAGVETRTATATVTVAAAPAGAGIAFCADALPLWVGYQASEGAAWRRATLSVNGTASLPLTGPRSGVAFVTRDGTGFRTTVVYGSPAELTAYGANLCDVAPGGKRATGTVVGLGATDQATITLGSAATGVSGAAGTGFTLTGIQPGPRDLLATRTAFSFGPGGATISVNRGLLRRNVNVADGGVLAPIDFGGPESFAPVTANVTIAGANGEVAFPTVLYQTANGSGSAFYSGIGAFLGGGAPPATQQYAGVPTDRQAAGDFHILAVVAFPGTPANPDPTRTRTAGVFFRTVADRTVTLGAALNAPTVTLAATAPYARPRVQLARQGEYADALTAIFFQTTASPRGAAITVLGSYTGGGNWDATFPDLPTAEGYDPTWGLQTGTAIDWVVSASGGSITTLVGGTPAEGSSFRSASRIGALGAAAALRARRTR